MHFVISFAMAAGPALYLVAYFYAQDRRRPEPKGLVFLAFVWGFVAIIPAGLLEALFSSLLAERMAVPLMRRAVEAFVVVALCEEGLKLLVVMVCCYRRRAFDEVMDGIVYTVVASLGFACLENIIFVVDAGLKVAVARAFTAVPMHAIASALMGYYVGLSHFAATRRRRNLGLATGLAWAIGYHGTYDWLLLVQPQIGRFAFMGLVTVLAVGVLHVHYLLTKARELDAAAQRA
ncbi:MAG: PrsW family glutamic-type intramembrane protease [candidate division KSB1 bacterium]|nr:PrsW family glutamic-type intramembrane protease [candidate division KSB1 bacterium]